jgi:hypothetical protein
MLSLKEGREWRIRVIHAGDTLLKIVSIMDRFLLMLQKWQEHIVVEKDYGL